MSRWLVGSSNTRKLASAVSALANATRDFSPPESTFTFLNTSSPVNKKDPNLLRSSVSVCFGANACNSNKAVCSRCSASSWCLAKNVCVTLLPVYLLTLKSLSAPAMMRSSVDLPLPLAPINAILSPFSMTASVWVTISMPGYFFVRLSSVTTCLPDCFEKRKLKFTVGLSSSTSSTRSSLSNALYAGLRHFCFGRLCPETQLYQTFFLLYF